MEEVLEAAALAARFLLGLVFLSASVAKLLEPGDFGLAVSRYELVSERRSAQIARWLPRVELATALTLLVGVALPLAAGLAALLLGGFAGAIAVNLLRGRRIDCGCHTSTAPQEIGWRLVTRDVGLALLAVLVAVESAKALSLDGALSAAPSSIPSSDGFAIALSTVSGYVAWTIAREFQRVHSLASGLTRRTE